MLPETIIMTHNETRSGSSLMRKGWKMNKAQLKNPKVKFMKYKNQQQLAEKILDALNVTKETEGYLVMINGKYGYHEMTEENQSQLIDEVIAESNVEWFDGDQKEGTIEINGKQLMFSYA